MKRRIFGLGETVLDIIFKNNIPLAAVPGGSAFNSMISLGRSLGKSFPDIPVSMITQTGDDYVGKMVDDFMRKNNVSTDLVIRNAGMQTNVSMAFLDDKNDANYEFYKDHTPATLDAEIFANMPFSKDDILLTSSFFAINPAIRDFTLSLLKRAREAGALIYYDVNFRRSHAAHKDELIDNILENMALSDIVRGSTEDFEILFGAYAPEEVYSRYVRERCPMFICTDGARPLTLITPTFTEHFPIPVIDTVSTIGAGDSFNAGIVYGLVEAGISIDDFAEAGAEVWNMLIAYGQSFSAEVCRSIFNYIAER